MVCYYLISLPLSHCSSFLTYLAAAVRTLPCDTPVLAGMDDTWVLLCNIQLAAHIAGIVVRMPFVVFSVRASGDTLMEAGLCACVVGHANILQRRKRGKRPGWRQ